MSSAPRPERAETFPRWFAQIALAVSDSSLLSGMLVSCMGMEWVVRLVLGLLVVNVALAGLSVALVWAREPLPLVLPAGMAAVIGLWATFGFRAEGRA